MDRLLVNTTNGVSATVSSGLRTLFPTEIVAVSSVSSVQATTILVAALRRGCGAGLMAAEEHVAYPTLDSDGAPAFMILENGTSTGLRYNNPEDATRAVVEAAYGKKA